MQRYPVGQKLFLCFAIFAKSSKWQPFLARQTFLEIQMATPQIHPMGQKFHQNCSILHSFWDISIFVFWNFLQKFENSKWPPFLERQNFFENWDGYSTDIPFGSKILSKSLYLAWFSRYKHFCDLQIVGKIQNGRHFWRDKKFLELQMATLQRFPVGQKFRRNCSISHDFWDISIFLFCNFCKNLKNSKLPLFLVRQIFLENWDDLTLCIYPMDQKFRQNCSI